MKFYKYILPSILALAAVSCTAPFDMQLDDDPVIFLESFPGSDEFVVFDIKPAYSKSNSPKKPEFRPEVILTVNGKPVPVAKNTGSCVTDKYPQTRYIAVYKPVPGDRMRVDVSYEGFASVYAETVVPAPFPSRKIDYRRELFGENELNVIYVTPEASDAHHGFALQIYEECEYVTGEGVDYYTGRYAGDRITENYMLAPGTMDGMAVSFDGGNMSIWRNDQEDAHKIMQIALPGYTSAGTDSYEHFFPYEGEYIIYDDMGEEIGKGIQRSRHKLILYSLSDEFYKYMVARELVDSNAGFFAGLAPSNFCYTNVKGGYGAFAAVSWVETDWITREFIENNR